jgi:hypothetical protein
MLRKAFALASTASASLNKKLIIAKMMAVQSTGQIAAWAKLPLSKIPGGGAVINVVRKIFVTFDD